MQVSSQIQNDDFVKFKEEILKKMRLMENKFSSDFNSKISNVNTTFDKMDLRIKVISQNINSLLEMVSKQNIDTDKLNQFDSFKNKTDQMFVSQKIQYKNILYEMNKMKDKYDNIIEKNLVIPGFIGPGAIYKSISEFLVYQYEEFNKIRNQSEQNKKKVGDWEKTAISIISNSLFRFQTSINNKNKEMAIDFEKRYDKFNNKILAVETELEKYQFKMDKVIKSVQSDIKEIITKRKDDNENMEKKLEEINQKIDSIFQDFESFKRLKYKIFSHNRTSTIKSIDNNAANDNNNIFFIKKNSLEIQEKNKSLNATNKEEDQKNNSNTINNNNEHVSQIFSGLNSPKRKSSLGELNNNNNEVKNNNEKNNFPKLIKKLSEERNNKELNKSNNQLNVSMKNLDSVKLVEKRNDTKKISNIRKINLSNNASDDKIIRENSKNKRKIDKSTNVDNQNTTTKLNELSKYNNLKEYNTSLKKNESSNDGMDKINIEGLLKNFGGTEKKDTEKMFIQSLISSSSSEIKQIKSKQNNIKIELNNKDNINLKSFVAQKNYITRNLKKNPKNKKNDFKMNTNIEHNKIMSKIREFYDNRRKQNEIKSTEKIVDCNLINLNLGEISKFNKGSSQSSPRNTIYSSRFPKMSRETNFGKTSFQFFSKRGRNTRSRSLNNSSNKNNF